MSGENISGHPGWGSRFFASLWNNSYHILFHRQCFVNLKVSQVYTGRQYDKNHLPA
jgi:hypothetical protein